MKHALTPSIENSDIANMAELARSHIRFFVRELFWENRRIVPAFDHLIIKAGFADDTAGQQEFMWIDEVEFTGDGFKGMLLNSPHQLQSVSAGDPVFVSLSNVVDWLMSQNGRVYGGFTVAAIRNAMSSQERNEHDEAWGLDFPEPPSLDLFPEESITTDEETGIQEHAIAHHFASQVKDQITSPELANEPNEQTGWTYLHYCGITGSVHGVKTLLQIGADPNLRCHADETPRELAVRLGWGDLGL